MTEQEDEATRRERIYASALPAHPDFEDKLLALKGMVEARRKDAAAEARYEALRDELAEDLKESGPRYFVDHNGDKQYAYPVAPEIIVVDEQAMQAMVEEGALAKEEYERIYPRRLDKEALRRSISRKRGGLTNAQVVRAVRFKPGTAYVKFDTPDEAHE